MIVVMVYRPEAGEYPPGMHEDDPFDGIEIYGMYYEAEEKYVLEMVDELKDKNPKWHFHIDPHVKSYVGFHTDRLKVPRQAGHRE
jgi:hypothetical protein